MGAPQKALRGKGQGARPAAQGWRSSLSSRPSRLGPWKLREPEEAQQTFHPFGPRLPSSRGRTLSDRPKGTGQASAGAQGPGYRSEQPGPGDARTAGSRGWRFGPRRSVAGGAGGAEGGPTAIGAQPSAASQWVARASRGRGGSRVLGSVTRHGRSAVLLTTRVPGRRRRPRQVSALARRGCSSGRDWGVPDGGPQGGRRRRLRSRVGGPRGNRLRGRAGPRPGGRLRLCGRFTRRAAGGGHRGAGSSGRASSLGGRGRGASRPGGAGGRGRQETDRG